MFTFQLYKKEQNKSKIQTKQWKQTKAFRQRDFRFKVLVKYFIQA